MPVMATADLTLPVTGGARGIGAATARLLAAKGAKVRIADVRDTEGAALAAPIGPNARDRRLDVTSEADWAATLAEAEAAFGGLDALVNNAGIVQVAPVQD